MNWIRRILGLSWVRWTKGQVTRWHCKNCGEESLPIVKLGDVMEGRWRSGFAVGLVDPDAIRCRRCWAQTMILEVELTPWSKVKTMPKEPDIV